MKRAEHKTFLTDIILHVSKENYALYLRLDESAVLESWEVAPRVILDFNARNEVVGIEMLHLSKRSSLFDRTLQYTDIRQIESKVAEEPAVTGRKNVRTP